MSPGEEVIVARDPLLALALSIMDDSLTAVVGRGAAIAAARA
jgi:hypothetical protein